jgi:hypothetical protein
LGSFVIFFLKLIQLVHSKVRGKLLDHHFSLPRLLLQLKKIKKIKEKIAIRNIGARQNDPVPKAKNLNMLAVSLERVM